MFDIKFKFLECLPKYFKNNIDKFSRLSDWYEAYILKHFGIELKLVNFNTLNANQLDMTRNLVKIRYYICN